MPLAAAAAMLGQSIAPSRASPRAWPVTNSTPWAWSRWVSGTSIDVAAARPAVMPLTTSTSRPSARRCADFLAAAAEHERIAALEANDALAAQRLGGHQPLDEGLRRARAAAALADVDDARRAARVARARRRRRDRRPAAPWPGGWRGSPSRSAAPGRPGRRRPGGPTGRPRGRPSCDRSAVGRACGGRGGHAAGRGDALGQARAAVGAALELGLDEAQQRVARRPLAADAGRRSRAR